MRLFLSSFRLRGPVPELVELVGPDARAVIIANALDNLSDFRRGEWIDRERVALGYSGVTSVELDLRDFYGDVDALPTTLATMDLVWATGGNAFVLRDAFRRSGLDALLGERLGDDSLAYGGFSAGACVCGPTLRGLELVDDSAAVTDPCWDGLGLVRYSIAPHYRSDHAESDAIEDVVRYFQANDMPYRALRDGEALLIRGTSPEQLVSV